MKQNIKSQSLMLDLELRSWQFFAFQAGFWFKWKEKTNRFLENEVRDKQLTLSKTWKTLALFSSRL